MNSKPASFQLEKTVPGTFLTQGLLGGMLGGFVAAIIAATAWNESDFIIVLNLTVLAVGTGGIVGLIKGTVMFGVVRLTGIPYRAVTRVAATSVVASLFIAVLGRQFDFDETFLPGCLIWALSVGIPVALLVGSKVKPWELFTFGSIAAAVDERSGSKTILGTLGTLPLRFLSIGTLALWLLYLVPQARNVHLPGEVLGGFLLFGIVGAYPFYSAYVTFRSPRKIVLFLIGVLINIPIALIGLYNYAIYPKFYWLGEAPLIIAIFCALFLVMWMIFLVARLSVRIHPAPSTEFSNNKSIADAPNLDHECLGSRFAAWQQRAA